MFYNQSSHTNCQVSPETFDTFGRKQEENHKIFPFITFRSLKIHLSLQCVVQCSRCSIVRQNCASSTLELHGRKLLLHHCRGCFLWEGSLSDHQK